MHFIVTVHGKGACNRIEETVRSSFANASLQKPYNELIITLLNSYSFCKSFKYSTNSKASSKICTKLYSASPL